MNPYDMLNVRDNASDSEIKKSYLFYKNKYNLKEYNGDKSYAVKRLADIEKAYKILSNPQLRAAFDHRHDTHVKSHISKKDVYKEMYVDDPIGTHEHHDFEIAMKRYNSKKSFFDLYRNPIKTFGDDIFDDENIQDYSNFTGKKVSNAFRNFLIAMIILFFAFSILSPIISIFNDLSDLVKDVVTTDEESTLTFDTEYNTYDQYYDKNLDYKDGPHSINPSSSSPSSSSTSTYKHYEINDYYTDTQLREVYTDYYTDEFDSFADFKDYFNDLYTSNN